MPGMPLFGQWLVLLPLLFASGAAAACSILNELPEEKYRISDNLVLARQVATTREPSGREGDVWPRDYRQHVVWEVVKVWKGTAKVGDRFERTSVISANVPCSGHQALEEGQRVIFAAQHGSDFYRYYNSREDTITPLFNALSAGTATP